jgi:signal transduction histidine kinase
VLLYGDKVTRQDCPFIGIISSKYRGEELKPFKSYAAKYFNKGGGLIYVYAKNSEMQNLNYLGKLWEVDLNHFYIKKRIIFICREDYLVDDKFDKVGFLSAIESGLEELNKNKSKENRICITVDSFWNSIIKDNVQCFYDELNAFSKEKNSKIMLKYIMEELDEPYVHSLLNNHDFLLVDGPDDYEVYSSDQLIYQSLNILSMHSAINNKYEKEMIRVEYLKTLGELMEGTVHDINNLLVTILGYAQLSLVIDDSTELKDYLRIIYKTALDGKNITDRIQNYIRGSYDSLKGIYELDSIINSCIEMTKYKFKPSGNDNEGQLEMIVDLDSNGYVYANEYEVRQAVINIILNGVDAMEGSGTLTIKTYHIGSQLVLEITDTGKGMDEATKNKLFDPYFTTKGSKGTGLGLNIAKKIFDNHMAKVYVDSEISKGTKFTIYFPSVEKKYNVAEIKTNSYNIS